MCRNKEIQHKTEQQKNIINIKKWTRKIHMKLNDTKAHKKQLDRFANTKMRMELWGGGRWCISTLLHGAM